MMGNFKILAKALTQTISIFWYCMNKQGISNSMFIFYMRMMTAWVQKV